LRKFSPVIVDAFYDGFESSPTDPWALKEKHLPLPGREEGYAKVLFVGTTGAGKTSLLRHLIGSDPQKDRFPSTSTAKTTIADIEIITADDHNLYKGVITFFSEWAVRTSVRECVADACLAAWEKASNEKLVSRLLNHQDQKFRLSYILGSWKRSKDEEDEEDDWESEDKDSAIEPEIEEVGASVPTDEERTKMRVVLEGYVHQIRHMADDAIQKLNKELGEDISVLRGTDREAAEELFDEKVQSLEGFDDLVDDIMDEVQQRFDSLTAGTLQRRRNGWPEVWTYEDEDRDTFLAQVKQFSSNYARSFGRLLTPIVQGVRVQGSFNPVFAENSQRLVLMDGQGLGHTPDSSTSVTTHITNRFESVDVILLVDNAQQPMQAAPLSVIRAIAASGYQQKLAIAFTHFDSVKGDNLPKFGDKKAHVLASVTNALRSLSDILGQPVVRAIERDLDRRCFMLGGLDKPLEEVSKRKLNRNELERLLQFCKEAIQPESPLKVTPIYDPAGLLFSAQRATSDFQKRWDAILGVKQLAGVHKEHWTRIRALNRRLAEETDVEYDTLKPVADLLARLNESISQFLDNPINWVAKPSSDEEAERAINAIRQKVFAALHSFTQERIARESLAHWVAAHRYCGRGSTTDRAREIKVIYDTAAPELGPVMNQTSQVFLRQIRDLVHKAIEQAGGEVRESITGWSE